MTNLQGQGRRLLVATSKPTVYADTITSHFGLSQFFESVHGSELDGTNSNKADLLGSIFGGDRNAVMIGDRSHDMIGAKAHGIPSIGVLWGYGSREELEAAGADQIAAEPLDLLAMTAVL